MIRFPMPGQSNSKPGTTKPESLYVTSEFLGSEQNWVQPSVSHYVLAADDNERLRGQLIEGAYVRVAGAGPLPFEIDPDLQAEFDLWDRASSADFAAFEAGL